MGEENISYCVLKNFDHLPEKPGRDVDIWVEKRDFHKCLRIMFAVSKSHGWRLLARSQTFFNTGEYCFLRRGHRTDNICILDISPYLHWRGINYLDDEVLAQRQHTLPNGIKVATPGIEAAALIFRGRMMGVIKEADRSRITRCLEEDAQGFLEVLVEPFGRGVAERILQAAKAGDWDFLEQNMDQFQRVILQRALRRRPWFQIRQWLRYFGASGKAILLGPTHGFFLALLGPDGAGKTTLARLLLEKAAVWKIFGRREYRYRRFHIPWLKRLTSKIKNTEVVNIDAEVRADGAIIPLGPVKATVYLIYLALEYILGYFYLNRFKMNGGLLIFDRYFYDYLVFEDFQRAPAWILRLLAKLVPRPDALIYLQNDPEIIHARKPERSVQEIARQAKICEDLVALLPPAYTLQTSKDPEELVEEIKEIIITNLLKRNRHFCSL